MMGYYDEIARGYEELYREEQEKKISKIIDFFPVKPEESLLDVGCGTGVTTRFWNCRRFGVDPARKLLLRAEGGAFVCGEAENLPFLDGAFDVVISVTAIQNFHGIKRGLLEIRRVMRKRGVLSFLKRSIKRGIIRKEIRSLFITDGEIYDDKDEIFIVSKDK